jgi:hypothetical protein
VERTISLIRKADLKSDVTDKPQKQKRSSLAYKISKTNLESDLTSAAEMRKSSRLVVQEDKETLLKYKN